MKNKILYVVVYGASIVAGFILYAVGKMAQTKTH
jgi:hypothetical protein